MEKKYHLNYNKFAYIYLLYIPLFAFIGHDSDKAFLEELPVTGFLIIAAVVATHFFFKKILYGRSVIVLTDEGVYTYNLLGDKEYMAYNEMSEPKAQQILMIKRTVFVNKNNSLHTLVVTNITENSEELIEAIKSRMKKP